MKLSIVDRNSAPAIAMLAERIGADIEQQFRAPDFDEMQARMGSKVIVDGRNLYQPHKLQAEGWDYLSVGRTSVSNKALAPVLYA